MKAHKIDFEKELLRGRKSYNEHVGKWWVKQSLNAAHERAYRTIAEQARRCAGASPRVIVDYACGPGQILAKLYKKFPKAEIIGIDGSSMMLELTEKRLQRIGGDFDKRVLLVESDLPNFSLDLPKADLLVFAFPNVVVRTKDQPYYDEHGYQDNPDAKTASFLASSREPDPSEETVTDEEDILFDNLLTGKVVSRNLRGLMKRGGICIRAEYSNAPREELTKLVQARQAFEEGSLGSFQGRKAVRLFSFRESFYYRSRVIEDVYHQTKDEADRTGGYFLNVLKAV